MIRVGPRGAFYCDGRECGYALSANPTGEFAGEWVIQCPDCGDAMYEGRPVTVRRPWGGGLATSLYSPVVLARLATATYQAGAA